MPARHFFLPLQELGPSFPPADRKHISLHLGVRQRERGTHTHTHFGVKKENVKFNFSQAKQTVPFSGDKKWAEYVYLFLFYPLQTIWLRCVCVSPAALQQQTSTSLLAKAIHIKSIFYTQNFSFFNQKVFYTPIRNMLWRTENIFILKNKTTATHFLSIGGFPLRLQPANWEGNISYSQSKTSSQKTEAGFVLGAFALVEWKYGSNHKAEGVKRTLEVDWVIRYWTDVALRHLAVWHHCIKLLIMDYSVREKKRNSTRHLLHLNEYVRLEKADLKKKIFLRLLHAHPPRCNTGASRGPHTGCQLRKTQRRRIHKEPLNQPTHRGRI